MIIKIEDEYYKIHLNGYDIKEKEIEIKILELLKCVKITLDISENYVCGDDASHLDTSAKARRDIYKKVVWEFGYNINFYKLENQEKITVL